LQPNPIKRNEICVKSQRKRFKEEKPVKLNIERLPFYTGDEAPVLIENVFKRPKKAKKSKTIKEESDDLIHVFVLIHGLDSSYIDMIPLMNEISIVNPNADFILPECMARANSHAEIQKLAKEVADDIIEKLNEEFNIEDVCKISFICHSLGGIVTRAAFPYLLEYKDKFHAY